MSPVFIDFEATSLFGGSYPIETAAACRSMVISDTPEFDGCWLGRLLEFLPGTPRIRLVQFDHLVHAAMSHEAQRAVYDHLAVCPAPHRAGDNAAQLVGAWSAGLRLRAAESARRPHGPALRLPGHCGNQEPVRWGALKVG